MDAVGLFGEEMDPTVIARRCSDSDPTVEGEGKDESVIVVGVLADDIDCLGAHQTPSASKP